MLMMKRLLAMLMLVSWFLFWCYLIWVKILLLILIFVSESMSFCCTCNDKTYDLKHDVTVPSLLRWVFPFLQLIIKYYELKGYQSNTLHLNLLGPLCKGPVPLYKYNKNGFVMWYMFLFNDFQSFSSYLHGFRGWTCNSLKKSCRDIRIYGAIYQNLILNNFHSIMLLKSCGFKI